MRACLFQNVGCLLLMGSPSLDLRLGQQWVGGFAGKGYMPGAKGARNFFPYIFPVAGQSVSGWVPLELNPSSPPLHGGTSSVVGACLFILPPLSSPLLKKKGLGSAAG